jgi:PAS domain S-box-containing protein
MNDSFLSSGLLNTIIEGSKDAIVAIDNKGLIILWNKAAEQIFGYSAGEVYKKDLHSIVAPERYLPAFKHAFSHFQKTGQGDAIGRTLELEANHKDGHEIIISLSLSVIMNEGEYYAVGIVRDISDQQKVELALQKNELLLKEVGRVVKLGYWELDLRSDTLWWSDEIYTIFGIDKTKFGATYEAFLNAIHPDDIERVNQAYTDSLKSQEPYEIDHRLLMADGSIKYVHEYCCTDFDEDGNAMRSVGTVQDITDRKRLEQDLSEINRMLEERIKAEVEKVRFQDNIIQQQQRFVDMGQVINAIAHQWRQPLNNIGLIGQFVAEKCIEMTDDNEMTDLIQKHSTLINQLSSIIDEFRFFYAKSEEKVTFNAVAELIRTVTLLREQFVAENINCVLYCSCGNEMMSYDMFNLNAYCDKGNDEIYGVCGDYRQALLNILLNARDAAKNGNNESQRIEIEVSVLPQSIKISVFNTGKHIPPGVKDRIFDPYFSTKDEGEGTGIGLYMTKIIIKNDFKGEIYAENVENGVKMDVVIPRN